MNVKTTNRSWPQALLFGAFCTVLLSLIWALQSRATAVAQSSQPDAPTSEGISSPATPQQTETVLAAGDVLITWPVDPALGFWGIAVTPHGLWVSSPMPAWGGNGQLHSYTFDGQPRNLTHPYNWVPAPASGPADFAYNWNTGHLWAMGVGGSNCLHQIHPETGVTGSTICPGFTNSQRGLAYNPVADTFYLGGWGERTVYEVSTAGTILREVNVDLAIAGLAYNPTTGHLFVQQNATNTTIHVLDANTPQFDSVGSFQPEGYVDYAGAGLEMDCSGNLWGVDIQNDKVDLIESGETTDVCANLTYAPSTLSQALQLGQSATKTFRLYNEGSTPLTYELSDMEIHRTIEPLLRPLGTESFSEAAPIGPLSVLSEEGSVLVDVQAPAVPDSWHSGVTPPTDMGLLRMGIAHCAGQPTTYYIISGVTSSLSITADMYRYNIATDSWSSMAPIPTGVEGVTAVCYNDYIFAMGGSGTNQFYIYDIGADSWHGATALPRNVWGAAAGAYDGRVYMIGGNDSFGFTTPSDAVDIYDIATGSWSSGTPMPHAAVAAGYAQVGQYIYVVGGWNEASPASNLQVTQRYNILTDSWDVLPNAFSSARADFALAATDTHLYALGGDLPSGNAFNAADLVEKFDYTNWPDASWTVVPDPLPEASTAMRVSACTTAFSGNQIWKIGGATPGLSVVNVEALYRPLIGERCLGPGNDAVWLSQSPSSGTIPAGGSATINVTFDANAVEHNGTYVADIFFASNSPNGITPLRATMQVREVSEIFLPLILRP